MFANSHQLFRSLAVGVVTLMSLAAAADPPVPKAEPVAKLDVKAHEFALSAKGDKIAVGTVDSKVRVFETSSGKLLTTYDHGRFCAVQLAFSDDGNTILCVSASGLFDGRRWVDVWSVVDNRKLFSSSTHEKDERLGHPFLATMSPDGKFLAMAGFRNDVDVIELSTGAHHICITKSMPEWLGFSHDGKTLCIAAALDAPWITMIRFETVTGNETGRCQWPDGHKFFWDVPSNRQGEVLTLHGRDLVAVGITDGKPRKLGTVLSEDDGGADLFPSIDWSRIAVETKRGTTIEIRDVATGKPIASMTHMYTPAVDGLKDATIPADLSSFRFSPDGTRLYAIASDSTVRWWPVPPVKTPGR